MPVIMIYSPMNQAPEGVLEKLCNNLMTILNLPANHAWAMWHTVHPSNAFRPNWNMVHAGNPAPVVVIYCKKTYSHDQVGQLMKTVRDTLVAAINCIPNEIFIILQRVEPYQLFARGSIWKDPADPMNETESILMKRIGTVHSPRREMTDDNWGSVISVIELDPDQFTEEALAGLHDFSHLEVVFYMHQVEKHKIQKGARHPRNQTDWPKVGIFAQRAKARPNQIAVSRCQLLRVQGLTLEVKALDAIDQTPVLDIKPYMVEFGPIGLVSQPVWATEIMEKYYKEE